MDLCSIEDAFPDIETGSVHKRWQGTGPSPTPFVGGTDSKPTKEERRAARKKAKKCKGPALAYSDSVVGDLPPTDPDRPAVQRMEAVESVQGQKEGFNIPVLPKASCLFSDAGTPSYFGLGEDDEEGFSTFSASPNDDPNYRLHPDFMKSFDLKGVAKAGGDAVLPEPELSDTWKPATGAASYTAFYSDEKDGSAEPGWAMSVESRDLQPRQLPPPPSFPVYSPEEAAGSVSGSSATIERDALMARINHLMGRLEQLEKKKSRDSQTEILMFVGTGLFLLLSFELVSRR
jgi:hypothetical protein